MNRPLPLSFACLLAATAPAGAAGGADSALAAYARGCLHQHRGDPAAAAAEFERARTAAPDSLVPTRRRAELLHAGGDLAGASALLREFAAAHPGDRVAQLEYAAFLRSSSPGDAIADRLAIETLEAALQRFPGDPAILLPLFRGYESAGRRDDSLALFRTAAGSAAGDAPLCLALASIGRSLFPRDSEEGRSRLDTLYRAALDAAPADAAVARAASDHFHITDRLDQAIEVLRAHARVAPESLDLRVRLGVLEFDAGRGADGVATLQAVLAVHPRHLLAHQALAKYFRRNDQPLEAREHAIRLLELRGGSVREFVDLADELLAEGAAREARLLLEKAVFHHPDEPALAARRAIAARRDPETAGSCSRWFREAEALAGAGPGATLDPAFLAEFAEALLAEGREPEAEQRLAQAIRAYPPEAGAQTAAAMRRLAGLWQAADRNQEAARALLQRADALDPPPSGER